MPAFNEARSLGAVVPQTLAALQQLSPQVELIVVDDGSQDDTASVMQQLCAAHDQVLYLKLSRNFGKESALTAGLDAARGKVVVQMDADGQHPHGAAARDALKMEAGCGCGVCAAQVPG